MLKVNRQACPELVEGTAKEKQKDQALAAEDSFQYPLEGYAEEEQTGNGESETGNGENRQFWLQGFPIHYLHSLFTAF